MVGRCSHLPYCGQIRPQSRGHHRKAGRPGTCNYLGHCRLSPRQSSPRLERRPRLPLPKPPCVCPWPHRLAARIAPRRFHPEVRRTSQGCTQWTRAQSSGQPDRLSSRPFPAGGWETGASCARRAQGDPTDGPRTRHLSQREPHAFRSRRSRGRVHRSKQRPSWWHRCLRRAQSLVHSLSSLVSRDKWMIGDVDFTSFHYFPQSLQKWSHGLAVQNPMAGAHGQIHPV